MAIHDVGAVVYEYTSSGRNVFLWSNNTSKITLLAPTIEYKRHKQTTHTVMVNHNKLSWFGLAIHQKQDHNQLISPKMSSLDKP